MIINVIGIFCELLIGMYLGIYAILNKKFAIGIITILLTLMIVLASTQLII